MGSSSQIFSLCVNFEFFPRLDPGWIYLLASCQRWIGLCLLLSLRAWINSLWFCLRPWSVSGWFCPLEWWIEASLKFSTKSPKPSRITQTPDKCGCRVTNTRNFAFCSVSVLILKHGWETMTFYSLLQAAAAVSQFSQVLEARLPNQPLSSYSAAAVLC